MAITVKEDIQARTGSSSLDTQRGRIIYEYTRTMIAHESGNTKLGPKAVMDAVFGYLNLNFGDPYVTDTESDSRALLTRCTPNQEAINKYQVQLFYTSNIDRTPAEIVENPLLRPTRYRMGSRNYRQGIERDEDGNSVTNSADEPFNPPPQINKAYGTLSFTKNVAFVNYNFLMEYVNTVNDASYAGFDRGSLRIDSFNVDGPNFENGYIYWQLQVEMEYRKAPGAVVIDGTVTSAIEGWDLLILDVSYNEKDTNKAKPIQQLGGGDINQQRFLDGAGGESTTPSYRKFKAYEYEDFSALNLI